MQGNGLVRVVPLPWCQPVPCPSSDQTRKHRPGELPIGLYRSFGYTDVQGGPLLINDSDNLPDWLARNLGVEDIVGAPVGFTGTVKTLEITGNARVERVVDRSHLILIIDRMRPVLH